MCWVVQGVSNFNILKLKRLVHESGITPAANQIEMNPYVSHYSSAWWWTATQEQIFPPTWSGKVLQEQQNPSHSSLSARRRTCTRGHRSKWEWASSGPSCELRWTIFDAAWDLYCGSQINYIAAVHQKTAAQIILAWIIAEGICVLPKSNCVEHIKDNFDVCFPLSMVEQQLVGTITSRAQPAQRNLVSVRHIGFDTFDEEVDRP